MQTQAARPPIWLVVIAFAAIYLIWGSTYLAIRWALQGLPPFFMAGSRFVVAGLFVGGWLVARGESLPTARQWVNAILLGFLMLVIANGGVCWVEQYLASGIVALFGAFSPMWMAGLDMIIPDRRGVRGQRPSLRVMAGIVLGTLGIALLVFGQKGDFSGLGEGPMVVPATIVMFFLPVAWALGSMLTRRLDRPSSTFMATAAQMLAGGCMMLALAGLRGEFRDVSLERLSWLSVLSHVYLITFGSVIALTAYTWLLANVSPARVATNGYVNPVVAVILGWALANEPITAATAVATIIIVISVAMIVTPTKPR